MDVVKTGSEKQNENPKESDNEVEESNNEVEKRVEIQKNTPTPSEREVVKEVEKGTPIFVSPPYTPPIYFSQRF